jgi:UDP-glucose:glycoprotein glucosyltransferase
LYTLGTEEIKSWHISPKVANYDLDNILLKSIDKSQRANGVSAIFELEYILIDGHCRDMSSQGPPRGLQFVLGSNNAPNMTDTIVMANLGYFQLKANPGVWQLSLRDGRSQEIYQLESVGTEGWLSPTVEESGNSIALLTFEGATIYPRVKKYKGKEQEDVLNTGVSNDVTSKDENEGTWSFLKNK